MVQVTRRRFLLGSLGGLAAAWLRPLGALAAPKTVRIICRRAWGARKPAGNMARHKIRRLTVHHSAVRLTNNRKAPERFRSHQRSHQGRGWADMAYHILIDRNGNVYEGRRRRFKGDTATNYDPRGHLLVLCEGDFESQRLRAAQVRSLVDVLAWAVERYDVPVKTIRGHRDYAATSCPGRRLYRLVSDGTLKRRVRRRLRAGGVRLERVCGAEGRRLVRRIEAGKL